MKILVACEFSGIVRDAFRAKGHEAVSCDILPPEKGLPHIQEDVLNHLSDGWDMLLGFPPCTYLTCTGNSWFLPKYKTRFPHREQDREDAVKFFMALANAPIERIALENPVGIMSTRWRKPEQIVQPYWFGHTETKKTCLWLKNLPKLVPTKLVEPKVYYYKGGLKKGRGDPFWHVDSMKLPPLERMKYRSRTFQGFADAMAQQWG